MVVVLVVVVVISVVSPVSVEVLLVAVAVEELIV